MVNIKGDHSFLIKTSWHQIGDYAKYVEYDTDVGCWATAIAQISYYHQFNPSGEIEYVTTKGKKISVDLDDYSFQYNQFVPKLDDHSNSIAKEQIAKYIFYIAALIYTDFGSHGYLEHETMVSRLKKYLNCEVEFHEYTKQKYLSNQAWIQKLIKQEIDNQRPLMIYFDNGKDFGHAAVLDGYIEEEDQFLIHLNMGWGGRHDGWYNAFEKFIGVRDDLQNRFLTTFAPRSSDQ